MMHPILQTLKRVHSYLRELPDIERGRIAVAVGLTRKALRHADRDSWEPRPSVLAKLDHLIPQGDGTLGTEVPGRKAQFGDIQQDFDVSKRENGAA